MGHDVIVVGAGISGLVASREASHAGLRTLVLEARDRLGGRTYYRHYAGTDVPLEFGGMSVSPTYHPRMMRLIERYGLELVQGAKPQTYVNVVGGAHLEGAVPVPADEMVGFERVMVALANGANRIEHGTPLDQQELADLDVPFTEFLESVDAPPATRDYLNACVINFGGNKPHLISTLSLMSWIAAFDASIWAFLMATGRRLAKGTKSLADALADDAASEIRFESPVSAVERDGDGVRVTTRAGESFEAAAAILATPLNTWKDVAFSPPLEPLKAEAAQQGHPSKNAKVLALVRNAPPGLYATLSNAPISMIKQYATDERGAFETVWTHIGAMDVRDKAAVEAAIRIVAPEADVLDVDIHDWVADEFSQGGAACFGPGQLTRFHSALSRAEGRVLFAGADVAPGWFGWMEGAVDAGERAANDAIALMAGTAGSSVPHT